MMKRRSLWIGVLAGLLCGLMPVALAPVLAAVQEPSGMQSRETEREGSISALDLKALPPTLKIMGAGGESWTLEVDRKETSVLQEGRAAKLDELRIGQQVKVKFVKRGGKELAKTIEVAKATPAAGQQQKKGPTGQQGERGTAPEPGAGT